MSCDRQGVISLLNLSMHLEREGRKYLELADLIKSILFNYLFPHMN